MRAPDRQLLAVVAELQQGIAAGREPQLTDAEWAALTAYIRDKQDKRGRRRGQHKSKARYLQGVDRRVLRNSMDWLKIKLRRDPAELELKGRMRASGGRYVLAKRVAQRMYERLQNSGRKNIPSVAYLENVLSRSTTAEPDREP